MTPLDTLKAGIKTAIITFIAASVAVAVGLLGALAEWAQGGQAPDLAAAKGIVIAAVLALAAGVANTLARYVQVTAVPFLGGFVDKILGAVPVYPEVHATKTVGEDAVPAAMAASGTTKVAADGCAAISRR